MQNRRLLKDDGRGVNEPLNEQGPQGGLYITAKYRVMLTERGKQQVSQQRAVQLEIDEPVQQLYSFNYQVSKGINPNIYEVEEEEMVT